MKKMSKPARRVEYPELSKYPHIALDTETTGIDFWKEKLFGISYALPNGKSGYFDIRQDPQALKWAKTELPRYKGLIAGHHIKFDAHHLREAGIKLRLENLRCTMIQEALLDEHRLSYDLDAVAKSYGHGGKAEHIWQILADQFGGKPTKDAQMKLGNHVKCDSALMAEYAVPDAELALAVYQDQLKCLKEQELEDVAKLEFDLLPVIIRLEHGGVRVDVPAAEKAVKKMTSIINQKQKDLDSMAGFAVNPNPSNSIQKLFAPKYVNGVWVARDGTHLGSTDGGKAQINDAALRAMKDPCALAVLELRQLLKTRDTFLLGHILGHHFNGVVHANFNQTKADNDRGTTTGRFSVNRPALQQIHKRNAEIAAIVRSLFVPDDGQKWSCLDYSQKDFRIFAHYVNDETLNSMYAKDPNTDFHKMVADLTGLPRSATYSGEPNAKQINLGLVFGMGEGKLAQTMGLPHTQQHRDGRTWVIPGPEAKEVFEKYHAAIPGIKSLLRGASSVAKSRGFVRTIIGRKIRFPGGQFTHKAGGLIFQGSAADSLKVKMVEIDDYLRSEGKGRMLMSVHDEISCSLEKRGAAQAHEEIKRIMEYRGKKPSRISFRIPIRAGGALGENWWSASK